MKTPSLFVAAIRRGDAEVEDQTFKRGVLVKTEALVERCLCTCSFLK